MLEVLVVAHLSIYIDCKNECMVAPTTACFLLDHLADHSALCRRIVVRCLNEGSGIKWWKFLGDNSHRVCWVGSFNSKYQLDTLTCMRARLQKMNLAPVIILDEADAALRSLFRTKVHS